VFCAQVRLKQSFLFFQQCKKSQ